MELNRSFEREIAIRQKKGFTLIELLVVIAIIALLMAVIMPALGKVKNTAKRIICQTNQHGIAQAYAAYASENDDRFVLIESSHPWFMTNRKGFPPGWRENRHRFEPYTTPDQFYCPAMGNGFGVKKSSDNDPSIPFGKYKYVGWSALPVHYKEDYYVVVGYSMLAGWGRVDNPLKYISSASRGNLDSQKDSADELPTRFSKLKNSATAPLLSDIAFTRYRDSLDDIVGEEWFPFTISGELDHINLVLSHVLTGNRVLGINTAYADGHVEWNTDDEILPRAWYTFGEIFYWY